MDGLELANYDISAYESTYWWDIRFDLHSMIFSP